MSAFQAPPPTELTPSDYARMLHDRLGRNGVYAVVGCWVVAANALAFRLRFPAQPGVGGKQFRPGGLVQDAANLQPHPMFNGGLGEWGRFHTFELPQIQVLADAAGGTYEIRMALLYLGKDEMLLQRN